MNISVLERWKIWFPLKAASQKSHYFPFILLRPVSAQEEKVYILHVCCAENGISFRKKSLARARASDGKKKERHERNHISTLILFEISCSRSKLYEIFIHFSTPPNRKHKMIFWCVVAPRKRQHEDDDDVSVKAEGGSPSHKRRRRLRGRIFILCVSVAPHRWDSPGNLFPAHSSIIRFHSSTKSSLWSFVWGRATFDSPRRSFPYLKPSRKRNCI